MKTIGLVIGERFGLTCADTQALRIRWRFESDGFKDQNRV